MTKIKIFTTLFVATISSFQFALGQTDLSGEWEAFCPVEYVDGIISKYCDLCESENIKGFGKIVYGFEVKIDKDSIYLKNSEGIKPLKYSWDKKTFTIEFQYKSRPYKFILLGSGHGDDLVLKNEDCLLLTLTSKKK